MNLIPDETERRALFPICRSKIYFAHGGVNALPAPVADAMCDYTRVASENPQEFGKVLQDIKDARRTCAEFIGAKPDEIALLGPTSLGLSLFANGLPWREGDEVLCYQGDYPANVYPWIELRRRGVSVRFLEPERLGEITPDLVEAALSPRTRLVALASCHFFTGYRIDVDAIGTLLQSRGVLFSLDAIQTLGAFPINVANVDFLSADSHKWLLGPLASGIVYVKRAHFDLLRPTLLGAWNVASPNFITQEEIAFVPTAQRYEPGVLNVVGMYGMIAAIELLTRFGRDAVAARLLELKAHLLSRIEPLGFVVVGPREGALASSITTFRHERASSSALFGALEAAGVVASLRHDRAGLDYLRFSPHFYNTEDEIDRAVEVLRAGI
ncbi:MAG TPA: aminotransferase class V-fold PLP-dependent enzyme [Chthoniobacteraceae bacterium]|jgi:selenocysteine lyase/cysteine desulfurase|nr:aminotransferase class V-fold PLP-dependent enzyme [Chthoniobacteraceae bacterium]